MVFGHALIILPAVTGLTLRYSPILYAPLAILHVSMLARLSGALADLRSEEHTSELQSLMRISYAVFCLKKKRTTTSTASQQQMRPSTHNMTQTNRNRRRAGRPTTQHT